MQAQKGQCSVDQEVQPPCVVISLSLSFLAFFQSLVLGFLSLYLVLGHISRVWQCLFYISCTLLGHTLWMQACILYLSCTFFGPHPLGMAISNLHFMYLMGPYYQNVGNFCFTFPLYVIALCMMYIYICLYMGDRALCMTDSCG